MDLDKECYAFPKDEYGEAYWEEGGNHYCEGNYEAAETDYTNALRFNTKSAWLWEGRGEARYEMGNYQGAIADYMEAIARVPYFVNALLGVARSLIKLGDCKTALGYYNELIRVAIEPGSETFLERAELRYQLGDYAGAIADRHQAKHGYQQAETMIEVYYMAHNDPRQSRILPGSNGLITAKTANYMLGVKDKRIRVETVEDRKNSTLYSIRAEQQIWDFYAQRS